MTEINRLFCLFIVGCCATIIPIVQRWPTTRCGVLPVGGRRFYYMTDKMNFYLTDKMNLYLTDKMNLYLTDKMNLYLTDKMHFYLTDKVNFYLTDKITSIRPIIPLVYDRYDHFYMTIRCTSI